MAAPCVRPHSAMAVKPVPTHKVAATAKLSIATSGWRRHASRADPSTLQYVRLTGGRWPSLVLTVLHQMVSELSVDTWLLIAPSAKTKCPCLSGAAT